MAREIGDHDTAGTRFRRYGEDQQGEYKGSCIAEAVANAVCLRQDSQWRKLNTVLALIRVTLHTPPGCEPSWPLRHRAHRGAWVSRRDLRGSNSLMDGRRPPLPAPLLEQNDPELRHRDPQRADLLISGSVGTLAAIGKSLPTVA